MVGRRCLIPMDVTTSPSSQIRNVHLYLYNHRKHPTFSSSSLGCLSRMIPLRIPASSMSLSLFINSIKTNDKLLVALMMNLACLVQVAIT